MKKSIIQGVISICLFFGMWLLLKEIDWVGIFKVEQFTDKTEQKLGDLFWEGIKKTEQENKNGDVTHAIDSLVNHICQSNNIDIEKLKVHVIMKDEINAFALPNGHLVIYSGLILNADNQDELAGVICHEIAHIELNHVMKKLTKEIGLSVLISITTGNGGTEVIKKTLKTLSSSAFDRSLEKEADIKAVDYLINANINPNNFANFLYKISENDSNIECYITWVSTHPESKERAKYIIEQSKGKLKQFKAILSNDTWNTLKEKLNAFHNDE
jgi:predicted Zn-dependent protease